MMVVYLLSFGPACWIASWTGIGGRFLAHLYGPIIMTMAVTDHERGHHFARKQEGIFYVHMHGRINGYAQICAADGWSWRYTAEYRRQHGNLERVSGKEWEWCDATKR